MAPKIRTNRAPIFTPTPQKDPCPRPYKSKPALLPLLNYRNTSTGDLKIDRVDEVIVRKNNNNKEMSGGKMSAATLSLALVGLLLLGHLTAPAAAKKDGHVMSVDGPSGGDEGRVVYADMKLSSSDAPVPAPAPGPSASDE